MRCERIREWFGDCLDGCLDPGRERDLHAHLEGCAACRREFEELRQTVELVRGLPQVAPPNDLIPAIHRRLERRRESLPVACWRILSLPQTRVAVAAALIIFLGAYGWRALMVQPPAPCATRACVESAAVKAMPDVAEAMFDEAPATISPLPADSSMLKRSRETAIGSGAANGYTYEKKAPDTSPKTAEAPRPSIPGPEKELPAELDRKAEPLTRVPGNLAPVPADAKPDAPAPVLDSVTKAVAEAADEGAARQPASRVARGAKPAESKDGETKGRIWGEDGAKLKEESTTGAGADALRIGGFSEPEANLEQQEARAPAAAARVVRAAAPANAPAPSRQAINHDLAVEARHADAARKIFARYAVPGREPLAKTQREEFKADDKTARLDAESGSAVVAQGWVSAAQYAQLLAEIQALGSSRRSKALLSDASGGRRNAFTSAPAGGMAAQSAQDAAALLFVRIMLDPAAE